MKNEILPLGVIPTTLHASGTVNGRLEILSRKHHMIWNKEYVQLCPIFTLMDVQNTLYQSKEEVIRDGVMILIGLLENYFSDPDCELGNDLLKTMLRKTVLYLRKLNQNYMNEEVRSSLMWMSLLSENKLIKYGERLEDGLIQMACQVKELSDADYKDTVIALSKKYFAMIFKENECREMLEEVFDCSLDSEADVYEKFLIELGIDRKLDEIQLSDIEKLSSFSLVSRCRNTKMDRIVHLIEE